MQQSLYEFGMVGLGVMGRNFLLNVADRGYSVIGMDRDADKAQALEQEAGTSRAKGTTSPEEFVSLLQKPRAIMLLVPAGPIVDAVIKDLLPLLEADDLIIDGGNSHFADTDRRLREVGEKGIRFLGVGVSGGAEGARRGPSIMPGGSRSAYEVVAPILEKVAAKVGDDPCVDFMGRGSAGHYVKMVHNGIEYGLMQLIAEAYDLLRRVGGLSNPQLADCFAQWNQGPLQSFLVEITAEIFRQKDEFGEGQLIDQILDKAKQKGTGKWTSQNAMDHGIPVPTIDAAVTMRELSALKAQRQAVAPNLSVNSSVAAPEHFTERVHDALLFATIISYAQGLHLLQEASEEHQYELQLEAIARIWRGGCIIRAALLEDIRKAYDAQAALYYLLAPRVLAPSLLQFLDATRQGVKTAIDAGLPCLALSSALSYFDAFRQERLPLNLTQAQRDHFGSHTYERVDRGGIFHTNWGH